MKLIIILLGLLALPGCAATTDIKLMEGVCSHQLSLGIAANAVLSNPKSSPRAIEGANVTLGLIAKCNPATPPTEVVSPGG